MSDNKFSQLDKNNVSAVGQLKKSGPVSMVNDGESGIKVLLVGNSITRHGIATHIGWHGDWGMAASDIQKDYAHLLLDKVNKDGKCARFCICQVAEWERNYKDGNTLFEKYQSARDFDADIIVMRIIENCPKTDFDEQLFKIRYNELIRYLDPSQKAKIIITTGFWHHPGDTAIIDYAKQNNLPLIELGDLGEMDEMKAVGIFEHNGVANHPGDLGMQMIADRIYEQLKTIL